ncbi:MAG TPA: hypothetical protein V6C76_13410 [Drouetiella sp.]
MTGTMTPPPAVNETPTIVDPSTQYPFVDRRKNGPRLKRGYQSAFAISFLVYALVNLYLSFSMPFEFDQYNYIYRGWSWWILNDLRKNPEPHNVALLGSSLMVSAVAGTDANHLNRRIDLTDHHKAAYLDDRLQAKFGGRFNTFNLSAPGQMPSDAYMMLKAMVNTADRPEVVIYGVAPRDFIDSTLSSPVDTEPFHYLKRIVNLDEVSNLLFRSPQAKLDFWASKSLYFYQYSLDIEMAFSKFMTEKLAVLLPPDKRHPFTYWDRTHLLPNYLPGEIKQGAIISAPMTQEEAKTHFSDNTTEYLQRYKKPDKHIYRTQFLFLDKLAEFCQREKIELIVVNMPITQYNVSILKPQIYFNYIQALRERAFYHNYMAYDLNNFEKYSRSDYHDPVHLNAFGGKKLFDNIVDILGTNIRTSSAMELAGKELERHRAVAEYNKQTANHGGMQPL